MATLHSTGLNHGALILGHCHFEAAVLSWHDALLFVPLTVFGLLHFMQLGTDMLLHARDSDQSFSGHETTAMVCFSTSSPKSCRAPDFDWELIRKHTKD